MKPERIDHPELQTEEVALKRWYLAYTKPRLEQIALLNLAQQGFEAWLPLFKKIKSTEDGLVAIFEPMFPRYILFRPRQPQQSISKVNNTKGVSNIERFGFEPAQAGPKSAAQTHRTQGYGRDYSKRFKQTRGGFARDIGTTHRGHHGTPRFTSHRLMTRGQSPYRCNM